MISKVFDNPNSKGQYVYGKRTICEVHRQIYDYLIINFYDKPKILEDIVPLLEEAFLLGCKITAKLIEKKIDTLENMTKNNDIEKIQQLRKERIRLANLVKENI